MSTVKRPLFVFAGQSNMEGGAAYPPSAQIRFSDSYEYLHKPRRFGEERGVFKKTAYPAGEFSYEKLDEAHTYSPGCADFEDIDIYPENKGYGDPLY